MRSLSISFKVSESARQMRLGFRVIQQIKLPIHLIGWIVFDVLERKGPLTGQSAHLAADSAPVPEVSVYAVVADVAGLVGRNSDFPALAFGRDVMLVEFSLINAVTAEVTGHSLCLSLLIGDLTFDVQFRCSR